VAAAAVLTPMLLQGVAAAVSLTDIVLQSVTAVAVVQLWLIIFLFASDWRLQKLSQPRQGTLFCSVAAAVVACSP
jgi:hypothetical protein